MADSSSDDDYMSDKLLQQAEQIGRIGLPLKKAQQRELEIAKRKAEANLARRTKKRHIIEDEQRTEGLSKPIDASNKGFALLSAMGFKPGMTLGAGSASDSATSADNRSTSTNRLIEPIPVKLKTDGRGGLGLAAEKEEKAVARLKAHMGDATGRPDPHVLADEFRRKKRGHFELKAIRDDLAKSRRVCRQLDLERGLTESDVDKLFWPPSADNEDAEKGAEDSSDPEDIPEDDVILRNLTRHLRTKYFYCIWCGCRYRDAEDLAECPGDTRDAHDED